MRVPFTGVSKIAFSLFVVAVCSCAWDAKGVPTQALLQRIYLGRTELIEAASDIDRTTWLLSIALKAQKPVNVPIEINVSVGAHKYQVPKHMFNKEYGVAATTHLFKLEGVGEQVGFVLFCGDGERTKWRLFRIDAQKQLIKWEDWSPSGRLNAQSDFELLEVESVGKVP